MRGNEQHLLSDFGAEEWGRVGQSTPTGGRRRGLKEALLAECWVWPLKEAFFFFFTVLLNANFGPQHLASPLAYFSSLSSELLSVRPTLLADMYYLGQGASSVCCVMRV